jgi:hypothetical protein
LEEFLDLVTNIAFRQLDILLGRAVVRHEVQEAVVSNVKLYSLSNNTTADKAHLQTYQLIFLTTDVGDVHVMGGRAQVFELLASEDVDGDEMDLCVAVLAGLGGGHFDNLAWAVLDHHEAVLAQRGALHRVRGRGAGVGTLEGVLLMLWLHVLLAVSSPFLDARRHGWGGGGMNIKQANFGDILGATVNGSSTQSPHAELPAAGMART